MDENQPYEELEKRMRQLEADAVTGDLNLIGTLPVGISITSPEGQVMHINAAGLRMFGYASREDFLKDPASDHYAHKEDRERFKSLHQQGLARDFETLFVRKDGTTFWGSITSVSRAAHHGGIQYISIFEDISERKAATDRADHLDRVLRAIRNVNQLITRETDRDRLLQAACDSLIETRGYYNVWIALLDDRGAMTTSATARLGSEFTAMIQRMQRGDLTACGRKALSQPGVVPTLDPASACGDCPLSAAYGNRGAMTIRLGHEGTVYGLLSASIPSQLINDSEEQGLFEEVGGDIAFAINAMDRREGLKKAEAALRDSEERMKLALTGGDLGTWDWNLQTDEVRFDARWTGMLGYGVEEIEPHLNAWEKLVHPEDLPAAYETLNAHLEGRSPSYEAEFRMRHKSGDWVWILDKGKIIERDADGHPVRACGTHLDITQRRRYEENLKEANRKLQASQTAALNILEELKAENLVRKAKEAELERVMMAIEQAGEVVMITDPEGTIQYVNPAFTAVTGYSREEAVGQNPRIFKSGRQDEAFYRHLWETITNGGVWKGRMVNKRKDGTLYTENATISPVFDAEGKIINYVGVKRDVTAHLELTAQLQQAQKMESVGRLAGGVAHDFNNKLTVILGYAQMSMEGRDRTDPIYENLQQVMNAGNQSVSIVRQLLAFARKQTISPEVLDLNETMEGMLKMLRRLIGEDIDLLWQPDSHLWSVKMDPSQIDQILANLSVNARDAISGVGKVTIETKNVALDANYCADRAGFVPGDYVMLGVSDNGCGMDKETLANAFEPFFTTKEVGKGTGLGLSTVYGIVKQNNGFVNIYSEPGKGSTFKIYLPRRGEKVEETVEAVKAEMPQGRGETILIVEDDAPVLGLARRTLENLGYGVLTSANPVDAIAIARDHDGEIHLLVTDVVLPEMSGKDLGVEISKIRPAIQILYMSGYTANVIAHQGVLDEGVHFIGKPFTPDSLARKVRDVLGTQSSERGRRS